MSFHPTLKRLEWNIVGHDHLTDTYKGHEDFWMAHPWQRLTLVMVNLKNFLSEDEVLTNVNSEKYDEIVDMRGTSIDRDNYYFIKLRAWFIYFYLQKLM